jgi:ribonuclease/clavin/mitogillin
VFKVDKYNVITRIMMGSDVNGRVLYSVAAYLIDGLLIDSGCHKSRWNLVNYLATQNTSLVVNTHHHVDHIGGNKVIMEKLKVNVFAPKESLSIIANRQNIFSYQEELWGCPEPCQVKALCDRIHTPRYSFQVVQTSGHSRDHVVFFLRENGWLFTGG